jgi:hypothetical protein
MTHPNDWQLNRRQWLLATTAALTACGGGAGGSITAALPGTGGTGIGMQGPITGFGSVIVNNTRFDDTAAGVYLDGIKLSSADLRVGMVAIIDGSLDTSGSSGSASRIDVWSIARGVVTPSDIAGSGFSMAGMQFSTDAATSFEGLVNIASIASSTALAIWGVQTSADARSWRATRVKVLATPAATMVSTGLFYAGSQTLNGMQLRGSAVSGFTDKQLLRVEGVFDSKTGELLVSKAAATGAEQRIPSSGLVELEGVVTALTSATAFSIGTLTVDASKAVVSGESRTFNLNSTVEATGTLQNGVLVASKLEIKSSIAAVQVDITGVVESFEGPDAFEVRGQHCDASNARVVSGLFTNLHAGTRVRVVGTSDGHETLKVFSIYIDVP